MSTKERGSLAEDLAVDFLRKQGQKIVTRNWKLKNFGEIDIIAQKGKVLNFVEVKALFSSLENFQPEDHFTKKKFEKLLKLANFYANKNNFENWIISLVAISLADDVKINY
ncbi:MAG: YraN family protein, partial [Leptonema sp. (in: bacteria)]